MEPSQAGLIENSTATEKPMNQRPFTISRAAREAGVGIETIRYYQRLGLIEEPARPAEGYRIYSEEHIRRLRFIKRAQELGFTLREIALLLDLGSRQCSETRSLAEDKLATVRAKIRDLQSIAATLEELIEHCASRDGDTVCPILFRIDPAARDEA